LILSGANLGGLIYLLQKKDVAKYLNEFQFGVRISGGAEPILHGANRVLSQRHRDGSLTMVDRTTLLREVRGICPSISLWV
jgi:hypothetical protein